MLTQRRIFDRIPYIRPLRPPAKRLFSRRSQLLLITRHAVRPQPPYLSSSIAPRRLSPLDQHVLRLLSTQTRDLWRDTAYLTIKWGALLYTVLFLVYVMLVGLGMEMIERETPTPSDWSFWTRYYMREAKTLEEIGSTTDATDWMAIAKKYLRVVTRLEDKSIDGRDLSIQGDEGAILIEDVGALGLDVSSKSWQWVEGYFQALMGLAQASENLDSMVRDTSRNLIFPRSTMIGPSNPDPRPVSKDMATAPLEEHCERPCDPPEKFYMQIITGKGFTTKQKLDAALAYANWLGYSSLDESVLEMLNWSVDIAKASLSQPEKCLQPGTAILQSDVVPSENLIRAVTALGVQKARMGDTAEALPVLLSALRARSQATVKPRHNPVQTQPTAKSDIGAVWEKLQLFLTPRPPPSQPSSGNDPMIKTSANDCEDSELMLYIGEIMYASSSKKHEGLTWTKRAVEIAEDRLRNIDLAAEDKRKLEMDVRKCQDCFKTGVRNWEFMVSDMDTKPSESRRNWQDWLSWTKVPEVIVDDSDRLDELKIIAQQLETQADATRRSSKFAMYKG